MQQWLLGNRQNAYHMKNYCFLSSGYDLPAFKVNKVHRTNEPLSHILDFKNPKLVCAITLKKFQAFSILRYLEVYFRLHHSLECDTEGPELVTVGRYECLSSGLERSRAILNVLGIHI